MLCYTEDIEIGTKKVQKIILSNEKGMSIELLSLGGIITRIYVPNRDGLIENVVLGFKNMEDYLEDEACFGALIGRTAGRIAQATFTLDGTSYHLPKNKGCHNLHGGVEGFHKKVWEAVTFEKENEVGVILSYRSKAFEEGYPGNVDIKVTYTLNTCNELKVAYEGVTDADTLVNLTNHSYFNLSGEAKAPITQHQLQIASDYVCELDADSIPTGQLKAVKDYQAFDFNTEKQIGKNIDHGYTKLQSGYDHPWVLNPLEEVALTYKDSVSGRMMEVRTSQKAVVIYTMNFAQTDKYLSNGELIKTRMGICFETQALPIGHGECFKEESVLRAGTCYKHETYFKFYNDREVDGIGSN